jgi:gliding motility-associated-like protein
MKVNKATILFCIAFVLLVINAKAQYISRSEPIPYNCPSVCAGGKLLLKINQIENFPTGTLIEALVSNVNGTFNTGITILPSIKYSLNQGITWINGAYTFNGNVNNLYFEIQFPSNQPLGSNYTIRMQASTGYQSPDLFQCNGGDKITITASYTPLNQVSDTLKTAGKWIAHAYTWTPTTSAILNTPSLIASQSFFSTSNYKGHFIKNSLNFDINYTAAGTIMPGIVGLNHDGTSFGCGEGYATNYSLRFYRKEFFSPGSYRFEIAGDDGIRLSIDGGATWLLDGFIEQTYNQSYKSTNTLYPNGICLSGNVNLVIEYFQRPVDARITFTTTLLSTPVFLIQSTKICAGENLEFNIGGPFGAQYQWQVSTDGGINFIDLNNTPPYTGVNTAVLQLNNTPASLNGNIFRCLLSGICNNPLTSDTAIIEVLPQATIKTHPIDVFACAGATAKFVVETSSGDNFQWQYSIDQGITFVDIVNDSLFSGSNSATLSINKTSENMNNWLFRCVVKGCNNDATSYNAELILEKVEKDNFVPNVFTPNGDQMNDTFRLIEDGLTDISLRIFNRWGTTLFEWQGPNAVWDGSYNGKPLSAGTYFYYVEAKSICSQKAYQLKGSLSLFK